MSFATGGTRRPLPDGNVAYRDAMNHLHDVVRRWASVDQTRQPRPAAQVPEELLPDATIRWGKPSDFLDNGFRALANDVSWVAQLPPLPLLEGNYSEEGKAWTDFKVSNPEDNEQFVILRRITEIAFTAPDRGEKNLGIWDPVSNPAGWQHHAQVTLSIPSGFSDHGEAYLRNSEGEAFQPVVLDPWHTVVEVGWDRGDFVLISVLCRPNVDGTFDVRLTNPDVPDANVYAPGQEFGDLPEDDADTPDVDEQQEAKGDRTEFMTYQGGTVQKTDPDEQSTYHKPEEAPSVDDEHPENTIRFTGQETRGAGDLTAPGGGLMAFDPGTNTMEGSRPDAPFYIGQFPHDGEPPEGSGGSIWKLDSNHLNVFRREAGLVNVFGGTFWGGLFNLHFYYVYREYSPARDIKYDPDPFVWALFFVDVVLIDKFYKEYLHGNGHSDRVMQFVIEAGGATDVHTGDMKGATFSPTSGKIRWAWYKGSARKSLDALKNMDLSGPPDGAAGSTPSADEVWAALLDGTGYLDGADIQRLQDGLVNKSGDESFPAGAGLTGDVTIRVTYEPNFRDKKLEEK